ncbi:MAG: hypothetical protein HC853_00025 [Anaerolineae bacterium]|nr:hypothetical protein [Anaerolineae bacterium]
MFKPKGKTSPKPTGVAAPAKDKSGLAPALVNVLDSTIADLVAPAALSLKHPDCAMFSPTEWIRTWYVRDWPEALGSRHWQRVLRFPGDVRVSMFMNPLPPVAVGRQLEQQATAMSAERVLRAMQKREQSLVVDRELQEIQAAQWNVQIEGEPWYIFTMAVSLYGTSKDDLDEWSLKLEDIFREGGIVFDRAVRQQKKGLTAMQPININTLGNHQRNMPVRALTHFFPFTGKEVLMKDGLYFGESKGNKMSVTLNPFEFENPSMVLIGPPGGGKSYWIKDFVTQCVTRGMRAYILDIEREYELLCEDLGGMYLDMGIKSKNKINVLDPDPQDDVPAYERTGLAGAIQDFKEWLGTAIRRPLSPGEVPVLDRCYEETFNNKGLYFDEPESLHRPAPLLSDLQTTLARDRSPYAIGLADELYPMAYGSEREAFNCETNVDVRSNPLVVFGLKGVPREMKARRIRQIQQLTWNQMLHNDQLRKTVEIVDEAWFLLQHEHTALDLAERARRFRKKNGALVIATQHAEDFSRSAAAEAVLEIAATHLLFRQKRNAIDRLASIFKLEPGESRSLLTMRKGEHLLLTNDMHQVLLKKVPPSRRELYTTKPEEVLAFREARRKRELEQAQAEVREQQEGNLL